MNRGLALSVLLVAAGCGGSDAETQNTEPEPVVDTSGDEATDEEPEPEPLQTGPGRLRVVNVVGGAEVGGEVQVLDPAGEVVAEGTSGDTFNVESGSYRVRGHITDRAILIGMPTTELDGTTTVSPGETSTAQVNFPVSHIIINVRRGGRPVARWRLTVTRENVAEPTEIVLEPSQTHIPITPGRYSGTLRMGSTEIAVSGLIFQGGARMNVPVNID